jgi:hypothetical protein
MNTLAPPSLQLSLLDVCPVLPVGSPGQLRTSVGTACSELAIRALNLLPIPINGSYPVNFDAQDQKGFYEIKASRGGTKTVLYNWRLDKEWDYASSLTYLFVIHQSEAGNLWPSLSEFSILRVPFLVVFEEARKTPLRLPKPCSQPRWGYTRKGYSQGYRNLSLKPLRKASRFSRSVAFELYGPRLAHIHEFP